MEDSASSNAALLRRIVQLENERDELRKDVEILCMQQSGQPANLDILSRLQSRRLVGLEQELEACKNRMAVYKRENHNLQEELSEAYHIKGQFADLHTVEVEKNKKAEDEIKFFQSKVAAAFVERDKLELEVEKAKRSEELLARKCAELECRLEEITRYYEMEHKSNGDLQRVLANATLDIEVFTQVIQRLWTAFKISDDLEEESDGRMAEDGWRAKANCLLNKLDGNWVLCENKLEGCEKGGLEESSVEKAKRSEELLARKCAELECRLEEITRFYEMEHKSNGDLQRVLANATLDIEVFTQVIRRLWTAFKISDDLEEVSDGRMAEDGWRAKANCLLNKLDGNWVLCENKLEGYDKGGLEESSKCNLGKLPVVDSLVSSSQIEKDEVLSTGDYIESRFQSFKVGMLDRGIAILAELNQLRAIHNQLRHEVSKLLEAEDQQLQLIRNKMQMICDGWNEQRSGKPGGYATDLHGSSEIGEEHIAGGDEKRDAETQDPFAQVLQEKVAALLLLSQEEERHHLEERTIMELEERIKDLNAKLFQATNEKVQALLEIARLKQALQQQEEQESFSQQSHSTRVSARLLPASWAEPTSAFVNERAVEVPPLNNNKNKNKSKVAKGYLKHWFKGVDISRPKLDNTQGWPSDIAGRDNSASALDNARSRVENVAIQERISSLQHLVASTNRLKSSLLKATFDLDTNDTNAATTTIKDILETIDAVSAEARQHKLALSCSLPLSWSAEGMEGADSSSVTDQEVTMNILLTVGMAMVELLLVTSQVQKETLTRLIV